MTKNYDIFKRIVTAIGIGLSAYAGVYQDVNFIIIGAVISIIGTIMLIQ